MSLILDGSVGVSDVDGSAATPAFRGADANTGMFFPAADTIAFSEGGTEVMRIDASGNVGIEVVPAAWQTAATVLQVGTRTALWQGTVGGANVTNNLYVDSSGLFTYLTTAAATHYNLSAGGEHAWFTAPSGTAGTAATLTERLRVNATGAIVLTAGNISANGTGITFPATQSASSDANTLDDYEEGSFTPVVQGVSSAGTATYSIQDGRYTKVGNLVNAVVYLAYTSGTGTGQLAINGLPFTSSSGGPSIPSFYFDGVTFTAGYYPQALLNSNGTRIDFYQTQGGASFTISYDAAATILLSITYRT
jgi:hypothetical protein